MVDVAISDLVSKFANGMMISTSDDVLVFEVLICWVDGRTNCQDIYQVQLDRKLATIRKLATNKKAISRTWVTKPSNVENCVMAMSRKNIKSMHVRAVTFTKASDDMLCDEPQQCMGLAMQLEPRPWPICPTDTKTLGQPKNLSDYITTLQEFQQTFKFAEPHE